MGCCASRDKGGSSKKPYEQPPGLKSALKSTDSSGSLSKKGSRVVFDELKNEEFEFSDDHSVRPTDSDNSATNGDFACPKCTAQVADGVSKCPGCKTPTEELRKMMQQAGVRRRLSVSGAKLAARAQK